MYFFYPETANLTLEEIDFLFTDRRHGNIRGTGTGIGSRAGSIEGGNVEIREDTAEKDGGSD